MGVVILLWALTALAVIVGRARRASWKTVRRYQAGQRALARLGPEPPAPASGDGESQPLRTGGEPDDDFSPHVRLLEGRHLPPPRPVFGQQLWTRPRHPGWARPDLDARPSVSIDTRTWSSAPDLGTDVSAPGSPGPSGPKATDAVTMASLIRVAQPFARRQRWASRAQPAPRPAKVLVGAAAALLALLATGVAATMHTGPSAASVTTRRAATTRLAAAAAPVEAPRTATPAAAPAAFPVQVSGDAQQATVTATGSAVAVAASAPCWIQVRAGATGAVLAQSTLSAGQTATFPWQDGLWMRLGDPSGVTVSIDGRSLALPAQAGQPMNVSFARAPG